jgi:hypothetical protein
VRAAVLERLDSLIASGLYDGIFFDRMRFPSPVEDPARWLACFCPDCLAKSATRRNEIADLLTRPLEFLQNLLGNGTHAALNEFLVFRKNTISQLIMDGAALISDAGLDVGLDCFSPSLTKMVGQDLAAFEQTGAWTKAMTYAHALGPAGMPFELVHLTEWMMQNGIVEPDALAALRDITGMSVPQSLADLKENGLPPEVLTHELKKGQQLGGQNILAGIELVELEGVTHLTTPQIKADLQAVKESGVNGLSLSWDLWLMEPERLKLVAEAFYND